MIKNLLPIPYKDHRTYDFHRTFGTVGVVPTEFNLNKIGLFPDQITDGLPQACTAYAQTCIASNEDGVYYDDPDFTYRNTLMMMGAAYGRPCDMLTALKSGTVYGVKQKTENPTQALTHRRAPYFIVRKTTDYFEGLISAMWIAQAGVSVGTPWPEWFQRVSIDGNIPAIAIDPNMDFTDGHDWIAYGVKMIDGVQKIICVSHQGKSFGNGGEVYLSRDQINNLLAIDGSGAFVQKHAEPGDIKPVEMTIIETAISYYQMWKNILLNSMTKTNMLDSFCQAIRDYEGAPGDRNYRNNNPGNCRYSAYGYLPIYGKVGKDSDGFAVFKDYPTGWLYLENFIKSKVHDFPNITFYQFFEGVPGVWPGYAPASDNNVPSKYAEYVAKICQVSPTSAISQLTA